MHLDLFPSLFVMSLLFQLQNLLHGCHGHFHHLDHQFHLDYLLWMLHHNHPTISGHYTKSHLNRGYRQHHQNRLVNDVHYLLLCQELQQQFPHQYILFRMHLKKNHLAKNAPLLMPHCLKEPSHFAFL